MLELSRSLNPDCRHVEGDMRWVRLGETFDAVFVHDAVAYITTEADLAATVATARGHCRPGGVALFVPTTSPSGSGPGPSSGGHDGPDRALRYVEWVWDPDPDDTTYVVDFAYLLRDETGAVRCEQDRHVCGLFPRATWLKLIEAAGFRTSTHVAQDDPDLPIEVLRRPRLEFAPMRRYHVTTFGCQMNAHDSERIKGMLEELGLGEATSQEEADVLVFNTCTIREKPDQRFAAHLAQARALKEREPGKVIAVGGCYAEAQRERMFDALPVRRRRLRARARSRISASGSARAGSGVARGAFGLDERALRRPAAEAARAGASRPGCRSRWAATRSARTASSRPCAGARCRGRRARSSPRSRASRATACARSRCSARTSTRTAATFRSRAADFAELLRACDAVDGIERIRFTSPHPKDFRAARDRGDGRRARGLRARAPPAPVRLDADPEGDAPHVLARALPRASWTSCGPRSRTSRSPPT